MRKTFGIFAMALLSLGFVNSQTVNDARNLYNQAIILVKTDASLAIDSIERCIVLCDQIGDSAALVLKEKATTFAPDIYYQKAQTLYYTEKKTNEAIQAAKVALKVSEKYNNTKTKEKLDKLMTQAYSTMAVSFLKANDAANAVKAFDSLLTISPDNYKALFNKSLAYKKLDNIAKYTETIDLCIEKAKAVNDTVQVAQANKVSIDYLRSAGNKANVANKLPEALTLLNATFKYGNDKDVYHNLANVFNKQKKFDEALTNAQKGLELEAGTPDVKAKFYYELAVAQAGKGDKASACASFTNALFGPFEVPSKAQMTNLKCGK